MGKFILAMNVSLDGYVDDLAGGLVMPPPSEQHFQYWIDTIKGHAATIYGRRMYEVMRYWGEDRAGWDAPRRDFAEAWRKMPKWVVSSTLTDVGPNATLISSNIEARVRALKAGTDGIISVSGPQLAGLMTELGLIDEYHMHLRPFVLGEGKPFFHGARPPLRLISSHQIDDDTMHLTYTAA
ncbi:deaminase reductase [Asticcacaulis sp. AC460]|uniref:dihydrofolate reductase family protein n=1 Tax=Asticcacaulis sp. AC460 TaxID=1282360 RepID=UPI0003C3C46E|nr:dihydrofolate reductase family protein [Asticcacaulis sp. AC460]ESQ87638.1 deaminase reductase [Asticcacaulis sp. AC460]